MAYGTDYLRYTETYRGFESLPSPPVFAKTRLLPGTADTQSARSPSGRRRFLLSFLLFPLRKRRRRTQAQLPFPTYPGHLTRLIFFRLFELFAMGHLETLETIDYHFFPNGRNPTFLNDFLSLSNHEGDIR